MDRVPAKCVLMRTTLHVGMLDFTARYDCEFLGDGKRLVVTPGTDRAHLAGLSAFRAQLAGAQPSAACETKTGKKRRLKQEDVCGWPAGPDGDAAARGVLRLRAVQPVQELNGVKLG